MGKSSMNACSARSTGPTDAGRRPRKCARASLLFQLPLFSRWLQGMASTEGKSNQPARNAGRPLTLRWVTRPLKLT